jgi:hypothetical protein
MCSEQLWFVHEPIVIWTELECYIWLRFSAIEICALVSLLVAGLYTDFVQ